MHKSWNILKRFAFSAPNMLGLGRASDLFTGTLDSKTMQRAAPYSIFKNYQLGSGWAIHGRRTATPQLKCAISHMAWLKLMCSVKNRKQTITTPLGEYLKTPLKNCVGLCPCRVPDEKPHCYAGMHCPWSYSNVNSGVLKQPKPRFDGYLHTLLHEHYASQKFSKSRPRSQDLYIHVNRNNRYAKGTED